jgi:hypothetical protein
MKDVTGVGCNKNGAPERDDLPLHDMTGGNSFVPLIIESVYPGETDPAALDSGMARVRGMLQRAAGMQLSVTESGDSLALLVHVINETGHKLPSGYPEGRRIWLNVQVYDSTDQLLYESGAYDTATALLTHDAESKVYEIKPGISNSLSSIIGLPAGPSFHFVLNDTIYSDNRIPPRGFTNADYTAIQSPPVAYSYADGQYWDDTEYIISGNAARILVRLLYQTTSKEYIEFLRDENITDNWGDTLYSLWSTFGKSAPEVMLFDSLLVTPPGEVCCEGRRGNVDGIDDGGTDIDIGDLVYLVDYMFTAGPQPSCVEETNIDGSCCSLGSSESFSDVDISDLVYLIDFMFNDGDPPPACPQ